MRRGAAAAAARNGDCDIMQDRLPRRVDTKTLLQWAFRNELPKDARSQAFAGGAVSPGFQLADLGTRVDDWSHEPGFPAALGPPHPDALAVEAAVLALEDVAVDWPGTRALLMDELGGLLDDRDPALSHLTVGLSGLVALHARMGTRPRWNYGPLPEPVVGRNGKPAVQFLDDKGRLVDGRRGRHYGPGARCPLMWFPAAREAAYARIEYWLWAEALDELAPALVGALAEHEALAPRLDRAPWRAKR